MQDTQNYTLHAYTLTDKDKLRDAADLLESLKEERKK
jgi:hypothetical protein